MRETGGQMQPRSILFFPFRRKGRQELQSGTWNWKRGLLRLPASDYPGTLPAGGEDVRCKQAVYPAW